MRNAEQLVWYLTDFARQGVDVGRYLAIRPSIPPDVAIALRAASWIQDAPRLEPTPEFRARARQRFADTIRGQGAREARRMSIVHRVVPSLRRVAVPLAASVALVFAVQGVFTASATALPDTPLYSAKLAFERFTIVAALTPDQRAPLTLLSRRRGCRKRRPRHRPAIRTRQHAFSETTSKR